MPKFTKLSLQTLKDRLGSEHGSGMSRGSDLHRHSFRMLWKCTCFATAEAGDKPMPADLTPWEQELFDKAPLPKDDWTLKACPQHSDVFADYPEEPD